MKVHITAIPRDIETDDLGRTSLISMLTGLVIPEGRWMVTSVWMYVEVELASEEEGQPVDLRVDVVRPGGNASVAFQRHATAPVRQVDDLPVIWGLRLQVPLRVFESGPYGLRFHANGQPLAERRLDIHRADP